MEEIKVGDIVELLKTATYYNGRIIPEWIKEDKWIVTNVCGDRVVIDKNVSKTRAICSPVNVRNVVKVSE